MDGTNKSIYLGGVTSLVANILFFFLNPNKNFGYQQFRFCIAFPLACAIFLIPLLFIATNFLRGGNPMNKWNVVLTKEILATEKSKIKKLFSRIYLWSIYPLCFLGGWLVIAAVFFNFSTKK
jgi:hypothetical protein